MPLIIGVVFRKNGNVHYYDPGEIELEIGDKAICHVDKAIEMSEVAASPTEVSENDMGATLSKIIRKATYYDLSVEELNRSKEEEGVKKFEELAKQHKLTMKLVDVHVMFDKSKMVFYFTAEKRVDFREMVKELASYFKIRIELRQIGVRDEAKIVGGLGPCGMNLCCKSFLTDFESISIKMAKDQNLPLNPLKISGICGRLMCCLKYEYESYKEFLEIAPERGVKVKTRLGIGVIVGHDPLKKSVIVEFTNENKISALLEEIEVTNEEAEIVTEE
ncbi:MAG: stage 0 sporulation protein [Candidatus Atribacteria bacterium]|nr:stage 0 sporulation protein [Candidatus Atribacteria bacterium]